MQLSPVQINNPGSRGFTLVEIIIAIFIFAIVISTVYGSFRVTLNIIDRAESRLNMVHSARNILDRFIDDLHSIVITEGGMVLGESQNFSGLRGDKLSFVSANHLQLSKKEAGGGYALISYHTEYDEEDEALNFYRSDTVLHPGAEQLEGATPSYLLGTGLQEVRITYFDREGNEADEWESGSLDTTGGSFHNNQDKLELPARIEISLFYGGGISEEQQFSYKTSIALPQQEQEEQ